MTQVKFFLSYDEELGTQPIGFLLFFFITMSWVETG